MYFIKAIISNMIWGVTPIYFYYLSDVDAYTFLAMQIITTFGWLMVFYRHEFSLSSIKYSLLSAILLMSNWAVYLLAIINNKTMEASLGYMIMPLITMFFGMLFLKEGFSAYQIVGALICVVGLSFDIIISGVVPLYGILIALTFSLYIFSHKVKNRNSPIASLKYETLLMLPLALLLLLKSDGGIDMISSEGFLLLFLGVVVVFPLALFVRAAKEITMIKLGMTQLISPITVAFVSVFFFGEAITGARLITLVCLVTGLFFMTFFKTRTPSAVR
ncbi:EamA family transporter [Edaphovirga cremea]|uniref:EamA family transporter n=1 Tax=Edaphovirga cremea TaxID=2267246 RepID=UPI000DEFC1D2|nr:EamA family transporter [Edaphovirga cremea]